MALEAVLMDKFSAELASLLAALADPTRLRLVNLIAGGEVCVCHLVDVLGQKQSKVSRHLAHLRKAGVVAARREGTWMHYRLMPQPDPASAGLLRAALEALANLPGSEEERAALARMLCAPPLVQLAAGQAAGLTAAPSGQI